MLHEDKERRKPLHASDDCDPWLSRAAREILRRHLSQWKGKQGRIHKKESNTCVWEYLDQLMPAGTMRDKNEHSVCPLHGVDVLRRLEENSLQVPSRRLSVGSASPYATDNNYNKDTLHSWYQCGFCQKKFLTRFYLDRHIMQNHHHPFLHNDDTSIPSSSQRLVCPATHWCRFLVDCYDVAVDMEPYYSAGSGGWSESDREKVAASVRQRIPPCREEILQETLQECRTMVDACFSHDSSLREHFMERLCAPQTCLDRLHRIVLRSSPLSSLSSSSSSSSLFANLLKLDNHLIMDWRDEWMEHGKDQWETQHVFAVLFLLVLVYFLVRGHRHRPRPRSRLLQKQRHKWSIPHSFRNNKQKQS